MTTLYLFSGPLHPLNTQFRLSEKFFFKYQLYTHFGVFEGSKPSFSSVSRIPTTTHESKYTVISFVSVCLCYDYLDLTRGHRWFCARATRGRNIGTK